MVRIKNKDSKLNLPSGHPTKLKSLIDFIKVKDSNTVFDVWSSKDIRPFICELQQYVTHLLS